MAIFNVKSAFSQLNNMHTVSAPKNLCEWVAVVQDEGEEAIEIPTENDGTILISSLAAQFPG